MKKRYWIIGLIILLLVSLKLYLNRHTVNCPEMNKAYFEWFPYKKNDVLFFSNADSIRKYRVDEFAVHHRENYNSNLKCGCCEEGIYLSLIGEKDTIKISLDNYKNPNSCLGGFTYFKRNGINLKKVKNDSSQKENSSQVWKFESFKIDKANGIDSLKWNNKIWNLYKKVNSNEKNTIQSNDC